MQRIVSYIRVSTRRQGESGLGLEAQRAAVENFAAANNAQIVAEYVEVESGRRSDRPELTKSLEHAKRTKATLVVAKLDRLARNVSFMAAMLDSDVEFVCCDNPQANRLTIHILAAVAEDEARRISERTKAALAAAKRRGVKLGAARPECRNLTAEARRRGSRAGVAVVKERASKTHSEVAAIVESLRAAGASLQTVADLLNAAGYSTSRGSKWNAAAVLKIERRRKVTETPRAPSSGVHGDEKIRLT